MGGRVRHVKARLWFLLAAFSVFAWAAIAYWRQASVPRLSSEARQALFYQDEIHPWVRSEHPDKCPICSMNLTPIYKGERRAKLKNAVMVRRSFDDDVARHVLFAD
jgi:hypothetical protein